MFLSFNLFHLQSMYYYGDPKLSESSNAFIQVCVWKQVDRNKTLKSLKFLISQ